MRSRGELARLEELLRMNDMILDSVADLRSYSAIFRGCKKEIAAERRAYIPPEMYSNKFQYIMVDHPEWHRFEKINSDRISEFAPLYPHIRMKECENGETRTVGSPKLNLLLDSSAIRHELESNPWSL
jgi:hypothetical protein